MTNLVAELRCTEGVFGSPTIRFWLDKAADRIEHLEAALKRIANPGAKVIDQASAVEAIAIALEALEGDE